MKTWPKGAASLHDLSCAHFGSSKCAAACLSFLSVVMASAVVVAAIVLVVVAMSVAALLGIGGAFTTLCADSGSCRWVTVSQWCGWAILAFLVTRISNS